jgi:hypothetical protein
VRVTESSLPDLLFLRVANRVPVLSACACSDEEVRDLLSDNPKIRMEVKEDPERGVFIKNLSQPEVTSVEQIENLMNAGNKNRSVGATAMNATSSRSHSLFTVRIETSEQVPGVDEPRIKAGKLNLGTDGQRQYKQVTESHFRLANY